MRGTRGIPIESTWGRVLKQFASFFLLMFFWDLCRRGVFLLVVLFLIAHLRAWADLKNCLLQLDLRSFSIAVHSKSTQSGWWFGTLCCPYLGMSSSQLTHIFQRGRYTTNQITIYNYRL